VCSDTFTQCQHQRISIFNPYPVAFCFLFAVTDWYTKRIALRHVNCCSNTVSDIVCERDAYTIFIT
jgi:hypothetical protein